MNRSNKILAGALLLLSTQTISAFNYNVIIVNNTGNNLKIRRMPIGKKKLFAKYKTKYTIKNGEVVVLSHFNNKEKLQYSSAKYFGFKDANLNKKMITNRLVVFYSDGAKEHTMVSDPLITKLLTDVKSFSAIKKDFRAQEPDLKRGNVQNPKKWYMSIKLIKKLTKWYEDPKNLRRWRIFINDLEEKNIKNPYGIKGVRFAEFSKSIKKLEKELDEIKDDVTIQFTEQEEPPTEEEVEETIEIGPEEDE